MTRAITGLSARRLAGIVGMACLMLAVAVPSWAQLGQGRMQGQVTDPEGNGLAGVVITAHNPSVSPSTLETTTGEGGRWAIAGFNNDTWTFTFTLDGYITQEIVASVQMLRRNPNMDVILEPSSSDVGVVRAGANMEAYQAGNQLFEAEDFAGAIAKWQEFLGDNPGVYQVYVNIGTAYRRMGDLEAAVENYESVLAQDPADPRALINLGEVLIELRRIEDALEYFKRVEESAPNDPAVMYNIGEIYFNTGDAAQAVVYYQKAIDIDPNYLSAYQQMGYAHINAGDMASAIAAFEAFLEHAEPGTQEAATVESILQALKDSQ